MIALTRVAVDGDDHHSEVASLRDWLADADELGFEVSEVLAAPPRAASGPVLDGLDLSLGSDQATTAFVTSLIAWIRHRTADVKVRIKKCGTTVELDARRIRELPIEDARAQVRTLVHALWYEPGERR